MERLNDYPEKFDLLRTIKRSSCRCDYGCRDRDTWDYVIHYRGCYCATSVCAAHMLTLERYFGVSAWPRNFIVPSLRILAEDALGVVE